MEPELFTSLSKAFLGTSQKSLTSDKALKDFSLVIENFISAIDDEQLKEFKAECVIKQPRLSNFLGFQPDGAYEKQSDLFVKFFLGQSPKKFEECLKRGFLNEKTVDHIFSKNDFLSIFLSWRSSEFDQITNVFEKNNLNFSDDTKEIIGKEIINKIKQGNLLTNRLPFFEGLLNFEDFLLDGLSKNVFKSLKYLEDENVLSICKKFRNKEMFSELINKELMKEKNCFEDKRITLEVMDLQNEFNTKRFNDVIDFSLSVHPENKFEFDYFLNEIEALKKKKIKTVLSYSVEDGFEFDSGSIFHDKTLNTFYEMLKSNIRNDEIPDLFFIENKNSYIYELEPADMGNARFVKVPIHRICAKLNRDGLLDKEGDVRIQKMLVDEWFDLGVSPRTYKDINQLMALSISINVLSEEENSFLIKEKAKNVSYNFLKGLYSSRMSNEDFIDTLLTNLPLEMNKIFEVVSERKNNNPDVGEEGCTELVEMAYVKLRLESGIDEKNTKINRLKI